MDIKWTGSDLEGIDSNISVLESYVDWPERGCNGEHSLVILSVSEGSHTMGTEILRFAQNDKGTLRMTKTRPG